MNLLMVQCLGAPIGVLVVFRGFQSDRARVRLDTLPQKRPVPYVRFICAGRRGWHSGRSRPRLQVLSARVRIYAIAFVAFGVAVIVVPVPLALGVAIATAIATPKISSWRVLRDARRLDRDLVAFVETVGRSLRAGVSGLESLREAAVAFGSHRCFADLGELCRRSGSVARTLEVWEAGVPSSDARRLVQLLRVGESIGGLRPQFLDGVARTFRESSQLSSEIRVLSDQARYSAVLMSVAPVGFALLLAGADPRAKHFLLDTSVGGALIVIGLLLDGAGLMWMQRLVRKVGVG